MAVEPYYQDDHVTIYNGRCEDVLPTLPLADLVFTSPPYNMGTSTGGGIKASGLWKRGAAVFGDGYDGHADAMPMPEYEAWQRDVLRLCWGQLTEDGAIFYNHKPRPMRTLWHPRCLVPDGLPIRQELIWRRGSGFNFAATHFLPTYEVILIIAQKAWRLKNVASAGVGDVWEITAESGSDHPCPFPISLPARAIEATAPRLVIDPFAGSGTTLLAAKRAGVPAIGIDLSERYCEMAAERCGGPIRPVAGGFDFGGAA